MRRPAPGLLAVNIKRKARAKAERDPGVKALPAEPPALRSDEAVVIPISKRLRLDQLTERTCKWPIGHPGEEGFHFCGHERVPGGRPYCAYHKRVSSGGLHNLESGLDRASTSQAERGEEA